MKRLKNKVILTFMLMLLSINEVFADVTAPIVDQYGIGYNDVITIFCIILALIIILIAILIVKKKNNSLNTNNKRKEKENEKNK